MSGVNPISGKWKRSAVWDCPHLIESIQLLRCDSNLCRHLLELDLQVFEVNLVSVAEFFGGRHFGVEAVDAVLRLGNSGLKD